MSISKDSEGIFVVLMYVVLFLSLFSTVGCGGRLRQQLAECESLKEECESDRAHLGETLSQTEAELRNAEDQIDRLTQEVDKLEKSKLRVESDLLSCNNNLERVEEEVQGCSIKKNTLEQKLRQARSEQRNEKDELTRKCTEQKRELTRKFNKEKGNLEKTLKQWKERTTKAENERDNYKRLVDQVPQARIISVTFGKKVRNRWSKDGIEIKGQFSVSNRKGHKVWAIAYFYFANGRILEDRNKKLVHRGQVAVHESFEPNYVKSPFKDEKFKLFMPFDELHVGQKHTLKFIIRIFDETTENYLESESHEKKFWCDPDKGHIRKID